MKSLQKALLEWYGKHRRVMPWRAHKGKKPNPYHVWLSEIMLQQTTVATVGAYFLKFIQKWPDIQALAAAEQDEVLAAWAGLGYYARARNLHACARVVAHEHKGKFPQTKEALLALPGIGPYTAGAIASIAFNQAEIAVDGNVERVISRYFAIEEPLPAAKTAIKQRAAEVVKNNPSPSDFTQALMELGSLVCTPRNPSCTQCPWQKGCIARAKGIAEDLPRKAPKMKRPLYKGKLYWVTNKSGACVLQKRTAKGLYQRMYQLPTTDWGKVKNEAAPDTWLKKIKAKPIAGAVVRHTLSHMDLELEVYAGRYEGKGLPEGMVWVNEADMENYALPTLMQKAVKLMRVKR